MQISWLNQGVLCGLGSQVSDTARGAWGIYAGTSGDLVWGRRFHKVRVEPGGSMQFPCLNQSFLGSRV